MQILGLDYIGFCERSGLDPTESLVAKDTFSVEGSWLAGGAIRRTLIGMPLDSDFDFFFKDENSMAVFNSNIVDVLGFKVTKETEHHTQYEGKVGEKDYIVQAIKFQFYDDPAQCIASFDYTISQFILDGNSLITTPESLWDLSRKRLAINKVTYPVSTMRRMIKYSNQGFKACAGCMGDLFTKTIENPQTWGTFDIQYID